MFSWTRRKKEASQSRDKIRDAKMNEGQSALLSAAVDTSLVAHEVTAILKAKLADSTKKFDATVKILHDALIICSPTGDILFANAIAEKVFGSNLCNRNFKEFLCPKENDLDIWTLLHKPHLYGACASQRCYDLDIKSDQLVWSDETRSIFIVIRDPFYDVVNITYDRTQCRDCLGAP